jgi:hypothetical protein
MEVTSRSSRPAKNGIRLNRMPHRDPVAPDIAAAVAGFDTNERFDPREIVTGNVDAVASRSV